MEKGSFTENYKLLKPDREDFYNVGDFNENADILDSALKALKDKLSSLAEVAESGDYEDLINKPLSLPANGGNADTVDGKHASDFVEYKEAVTDLFKVNPNGVCICKWDTATENTPLKAGLTVSEAGTAIINNAAGSQYTTYLVMPAGSSDIFVAVSVNEELYGDWKKISDGGNADTVNGVKLHPKNVGTLNTVSKPWFYAFEGGDDYNCYVKNTGDLEVGNSDKLGGLTASKYRGNPDFVYTNQNGGDLNDFKTEYQGFVFNMTNKPSACSYGFLNVDYFDGTGFAPASEGVVRQTYMDWQKADLCFVRFYTVDDDTWTNWIKIGGNADTLEGYTYDDIVSNAVDEVGFNGVVKNSFSGTADATLDTITPIVNEKYCYAARVELDNANNKNSIVSVSLYDGSRYDNYLAIGYHLYNNTLYIEAYSETAVSDKKVMVSYNVLTFY